jgi:hypothetical protein
MTTMMSACGVICSKCPAYQAKSRGPVWQQQVADAWHEIYGLNETAADISCGGCLSPDDQVFHSCSRCRARCCCRSKGLNSCAECPTTDCEDLEKAQSNWDGVPLIGASLSPAEFDLYARAYCGHRERLVAIRNGAPPPTSAG